VCLSVTDTGCGIPPEILPRIFEPFFTHQRGGEGTGLGLATVFGIVQQHKGGSRFSSARARAPTFRVYLPRLTTASDRKAPGLRWSPSAAEGNHLLVEDEAALRAAVRTVLAYLGYGCWKRPAVMKRCGCGNSTMGKSGCC